MQTDLDLHWYRVYVKNPGDFDAEFIELCLQRFGMNKNGAKKHYEMLKRHCPTGFTYACRTNTGGGEYVRLANDANYTVVEAPCFDDLGESLPEYAYVFKYAPESIIPADYQRIITAPENTVVNVCWGSLTGRIEYGSAKRLARRWYIYGQSNPHANGRPCATPTGWYKR